MTVGQEIKRLREKKGWSQAKLGVLAGTGPSGISQIETGRRNPSAATLERIARALGVEVRDLFPLGQVPLFQEPPEQEPAEERRAAWEAAADEARRLRETGWARMWKVLSEWRASKNRGEPYSTRRKYLDEMGNLLQEVRDADDALGWAYAEAGRTPPGAIEASLRSYLREESRKTSHFYGELLGLAKSARLSVITGEDAAAAKQASAEHVQSEMRPLRVEEPAA